VVVICAIPGISFGREIIRLGPCLVYPYFDATGRQTGYHRLKPSSPRTSKKKDDKDKKTKYEGPKDKPNRLYIPPGTRAALAVNGH